MKLIERNRGVRPASALRLVVLIGLLCAAICGVLFYVLVQHTHEDLQNRLEKRLEAAEKLFQHEILQETELLELELGEIEVTPSLQRRMAIGEYESLAAAEAARFARLRDGHAITHYYFIDAEGIARLRLHAPEKKGDKITRASLERARSTGAVSSGLEAGPLGTFTLRVVRPVVWDERVIGYLELGKEFDIITRHIHEALDVGIHVFVDNSLLASLPAPGSTDGAATSPLFEGQQRVFQVEPRLPPWFSKATVENRGALGGWAAARPYGDAPDTAVGVLPLRDASGAAVGDMVLVFDIEADVHAMRERNLVSGGALAGALVLLVLVAVSFARRLDRQVARTERVRAKLIGELEATIAERTADLRAEVAERERLEEARRRGERMEAIGQLTGGVAHEFNNLLQVVLGNLDLLLTRIEPGQSGHKFAAAARKAAMRGGELTQRLLSFGRRQSLAPRAVTLGAAITELIEVLRQTLPETVAVESRLSDDLWPVMVDAGQLEAAILNLVFNARDAMSGGGTLSLEAENRAIDRVLTLLNHELSVGDYVALTVRDTGAGITPEVLARVFEPFFTTKEVGQGTGLGLSMVHGFVSQSGGGVEIESAPGAGTTVTLYLPRAADGRGATPEPSAMVKPARCRVLLAEDDPQVRKMVSLMLSDMGHDVTQAATGREAFELLKGGDSFDCAITDVVLPGGLSSLDLVREIRGLGRATPVLLITGYSDQAEVASDLPTEGVTVLTKPFTQTMLATALAALLGGG